MALVNIFLTRTKVMKKSILLSIALALLYYVAYAGTEHFGTSAEQVVYENNKSVIDSLLNRRVSEQLVRMYHFYKVPDKAYKQLKHYTKQCEFMLICQDFLLVDSLVQRVENKIRIEQCYTDSINTILIPVDGNHISGDNVSYALRSKEILGLDSVQYDYIMKLAVDMARRIKVDYRINVWNEEMEVLKKTLNKQQLQSFFRIRNAQKVTAEFDEIIEKLKNANLTEQIDSVKDIPDAVNYLFNKQMVKDLYRNRGTEQKRYLIELDKNKPKIISLLDGIYKKEKYMEEEHKAMVGKEFIW